jgi:hypothetical protein
MPTQIRRPTARALASTAADVNSNSLTPLTIIAILIFVLHLAGAAMLGRSQARVIATAEAGCSGEPTQKERSLPYD